MISEGFVVCFGEVLIRLSPPEHELLLQSPRLTVRFGGAEANVAVSLSRLGQSARMISILPNNPLGRAAYDELRRHGVDVSLIRFMPGRMGLYFLTPGAAVRSSDVLYDRAGSAFAEALPGAIDWRGALEGAAVLHLSGVTPALNAKSAAAAFAAANAACELGVPVSFDGNYRASLWSQWDGDGPSILKRLLGCARLAFVDDRDIALILTLEFTSQDPAERRGQAAAAAFAAFPRLERIASTLRLPRAVDHHEYSAFMFVRDGRQFRTRERSLTGVVDRIGGGDAFAAGLIHALRSGQDDASALEFAAAAACLKHATPGDFNLAGETDVKVFLDQKSFDVRR